jgi:hypothetical protein
MKNLPIHIFVVLKTCMPFHIIAPHLTILASGNLRRVRSENKLNIEDCLKIGKQTTYALLGSGLHARQGMSPIIALTIWRTYVIPKLLYGIEIMTYTKTDVQKLERYN